MALLDVKHISAAYGSLQVLWDVSLEAGAGECVALLGPKGAGKTTLLQSIAGVIRPMAGQIVFNGVPVTGWHAHRVNQAGLSYIPQDPGLFEDMAVHKNLLAGACNTRDNKTIRQQMEYVLTLFPVLRECRNQLAGTLSGGEQRMLTLARGLMSTPRMLLVDEPSIGLAPLMAENVFAALRELYRQGITILVADQKVPMTLSIAQRAYVLEQGRVVLTGTGAELAENDHFRNAYLRVFSKEK